MALRTINFSSDPFNNRWKKDSNAEGENCELGTTNYNGGDDVVEHNMDALNLDQECPDPNTSQVSFGKYNLMYPSSENAIEWSEHLENIFTSNTTVISHDHYFFCNTDQISNLERGYFVRVIDEQEVEIGKLEAGSETIFKNFSMDLPAIRKFQLQYKFDSVNREATMRLRIINNQDNILKTIQVTDSNPADRLEPYKADPGYLNVVNYRDINNVNSNPFLDDEEYYDYELWELTVVEQLSDIVEDLSKDGRFYENNSNLAVDLIWRNLDSTVTNNLEEVSLRRKKNTFPKDHTDGTEIKNLSNPTVGEEVVVTDDSIQKNEEYFYVVFVKYDGSWVDKVRQYKNARIIDTSDIPPVKSVDNFNASSLSSTLAQLGWTNPFDDQLDEYRIVRRSDGFPEDYQDGEIVAEEQNPQPGNFVNKYDSGLEPNSFYYYAVFVKRSAGDVWNNQVIFSG